MNHYICSFINHPSQSPKSIIQTIPTSISKPIINHPKWIIFIIHPLIFQNFNPPNLLGLFYPHTRAALLVKPHHRGNRNLRWQGLERRLLEQKPKQSPRCGAKTFWANYTDPSLRSAKGILPMGWLALASSWGFNNKLPGIMTFILWNLT